MALEDLKQQKYEQNLAWGTFTEIQSEFGLGDLHGVIFGVCFGVECPKSAAQSSSKGREQLLLELPSSSHSMGRGAPNSGSAWLNSHLPWLHWFLLDLLVMWVACLFLLHS